MRGSGRNSRNMVDTDEEREWKLTFYVLKKTKSKWSKLINIWSGELMIMSLQVLNCFTRTQIRNKNRVGVSVRVNLTNKIWYRNRNFFMGG